ncbi:MAG: exodeoxyribonuclease VII small subunit [Geminicoccaceae bacterium]
MTDKTTKADKERAAAIAGMTFEQALGELEQIVQDLERGQLDLDAAIKAYERGTLLKAHCDGKLKEAQLRVDKITVGLDGKVMAEPAALT